MSVAPVQSALYDPNANGTAVAFTLGASPTPGNILLAFTGYSQFGGARTVGSAAGTWTKVDDATKNNDSLAVWWHLVVNGDGTTWSFPITGGSEGVGGVLYEISGSDTVSPINQHSILGFTSATPASTGIVPSVLSCLALTGMTWDASTVCTGVSSGWTLDQSGSQAHHACGAASRNALTSDTSTSITDTMTLGGSTDGVIAAVLINPPLPPAVPAEVPRGGHRPRPFGPGGAALTAFIMAMNRSPRPGDFFPPPPPVVDRIPGNHQPMMFAPGGDRNGTLRALDARSPNPADVFPGPGPVIDRPKGSTRPFPFLPAGGNNN